MAFIEAIPDDEAQGAAAQMYETARADVGYVPNYMRVFAHRPDVYEAWDALKTTIACSMDPRRYELATFAAARRLRSSYCALGHGKILAERFLGGPTVRELAVDHRAAGLDETEVAIMDLAEKVAADAASITAADVQRLRDAGLTDEEIFAVVAAAAVRCFFSKTLDALGAEPDAKYAGLDPELRDALTVGRPIAAV